MSRRDEPRVDGATHDGGKTALRATIRDVADDHLRDLWVIDPAGQEALYLREDVASNIEDVAVERYIDNERFGFVTRDIYDDLHYSEFGYTLRGFDTWELFRTFLVTEDTQVGVLSSFDRRDGGYDYSRLNESVQSLLDEYAVDAFVPVEG